MIKLLKQYQVQVTPFAATKDWNLNNSDNDNLLLFESTGSEDGLPIALEFLDYGDGSGYPVENALCDIALEQQTNDLATSQTGLNVKGIVNVDTEPLNDDGTYKRSIYHQVKTMFYNSYLDPSKIWGIENIDFTLSQTQRNLSDQFRLIDVPRSVYGDKIVPKSVRVYDNTLDNVYLIQDDGNGNLFAGKNLFSHQQELGEYINEFISHLSSSYCDDYWANHDHVTTETASMQIAFFGGRIESQLHTDTASMQIGFVYGSTQLMPPLIDYPVFNGILFVSGSTVNTVITDSSSVDYPVFTSMSFVSGSLITTTIFDSSSVDYPVFNRIFFVSGSQVTTTFLVTMSFNQMNSSIGFVGGNVI